MRIGVDIGGTFTDVVLDHPKGLQSTKVLTDYTAPEAAILRGIQAVAEQAETALADITQVIHGTTLVTNALIERRGAKTAFLTTEGFRDVVEMRTESRFEQYDLNLELPKPLVGRADRFVLKERIAADGSVLLPLDPVDLADRVEEIARGGYGAVAVGLIHAYANPEHEEAVADALAPLGLSVSLSSVVSPQMREFERFNTVIANAYVRPLVAAYLDRLVAALGQADIRAPVFMMHSGGGLIRVETAAEQPVRLLESGPAGGAIFAAGLASAHGVAKALSFDMGGTTAKICLIEDGQPKTAATFEVARTYRFKKGSGMPVSTPVVEMVEIGAGGGSIASIDALGRIQVGPRSAGSEPGPACYQRGGTAPTVTDANLVLGKLDPGNFAAGSIPLDPGLSHHAIASHLPDFTPDDAAFGITEMVDENMANAARVHSVENGRDIEAFTLVAFGGGAPLHACRQCEKLGLSRALIPVGAGVGSAIGFLRAPFSYEASRGFFQRLDRFDAAAVSQMLADLETEASAFVRQGAGAAATETRLTLYMRYKGQGWEIPVVIARSEAVDIAAILAAFETAYRQLFGRTIDGLAVEITNWSLIVATTRPAVSQVKPTERLRDAVSAATRALFDAGARRFVEARVVRRDEMLPGTCVQGPAVIVEDETTTIVTSRFLATVQADGSLLLERQP